MVKKALELVEQGLKSVYVMGGVGEKADANPPYLMQNRVTAHKRTDKRAEIADDFELTVRHDRESYGTYVLVISRDSILPIGGLDLGWCYP